MCLKLRHFVSLQQCDGSRQFVVSQKYILFHLKHMIVSDNSFHLKVYGSTEDSLFNLKSMVVYDSSFHPFPTHVTCVQGLCISSSLVPRNSISNIYHPWHPGPLHILILSSHNLQNISNFEIPWDPGPLPITILGTHKSLYLIVNIPGIQGLYTSSRLVPRISISNC